MRRGGLYLAFGDSITMSKTTQGKFLYTSLLRDAIYNNYGPINHINKGLPGTNSRNMIGSLQWSTRSKPDLVTLGVGMNDCSNQLVTVADYKTYLIAIIDRLRIRNPNAIIILCTPSQSTESQRAPYIQRYRDAMVEVATTKNVAVCHFENAWTYSTSDMTAYTVGDGIHPNDAGHQLLFNQLWTVVQTVATDWLNSLKNQ